MKQPTKYLLLFLPLTFTGCEDYLEQPVDQRTQLNTVEKVSELLTTAYPQADYVTFTEAMSDMAMDKGVSGVIVEEINESPYLFKDVESREEGSPVYYWNASYAAIASANHALEAIKNAENRSDYNAQRGEALLARAYSHFMLVSLFSEIYDPATAESAPGIPYVTEVEKQVFKDYERKTVAYVYEQIEKDIQEGIYYINNNAYRSPKYHFNTAAAHAFAARFYLFKKDYQRVIDHANRAFAGGNIISYLRPWVDVYSNLTAREGLAIFTQATEASNLLLAEAPSVWARNYGNYRYGLSTALVNEVFRSPNVTGETWVYPLYTRGDNNWLILKYREHFVRSDANANIGFAYTIFPLFTAEEVLFNRAEANLALGNTEAAREDLNLFASARIKDYEKSAHNITNDKLENFYGTSDVSVGLLAALLDFKRAEFVHEGMRWFDILRHDIPVYHPTASGEILELLPGDPRRVLQMPEEVDLAGIEQNPREESNE